MTNDEKNRKISEAIEPFEVLPAPIDDEREPDGKGQTLSALLAWYRDTEEVEFMYRSETHACGAWQPRAWDTDERASAQLRKWLAAKLCSENSFLTLEIFAADHFIFSQRNDEGERSRYAEAKTEMLAVREFALAMIEGGK